MQQQQQQKNQCKCKPVINLTTTTTTILDLEKRTKIKALLKKRNSSEVTKQRGYFRSIAAVEIAYGAANKETKYNTGISF